MKKILLFTFISLINISLFSQNLNREKNKTEVNSKMYKGRYFDNTKPFSTNEDTVKKTLDSTELVKKPVKSFLDSTKSPNYLIEDKYKMEKYVLDKKLENLSLNLIKANEYYQTGLIVQLSSFALGSILTYSGISNNNVQLRNFGYGVYGVGGIVSFGYIISAWQRFGKAGKGLR